MIMKHLFKLFTLVLLTMTVATACEDKDGIEGEGTSAIENDSVSAVIKKDTLPPFYENYVPTTLKDRALDYLAPADPYKELQGKWELIETIRIDMSLPIKLECSKTYEFKTDRRGSLLSTPLPNGSSSYEEFGYYFMPDYPFYGRYLLFVTETDYTGTPSLAGGGYKAVYECIFYGDYLYWTRQDISYSWGNGFEVFKRAQ